MTTTILPVPDSTKVCHVYATEGASDRASVYLRQDGRFDLLTDFFDQTCTDADHLRTCLARYGFTVLHSMESVKWWERE